MHLPREQLVGWLLLLLLACLILMGCAEDPGAENASDAAVSTTAQVTGGNVPADGAALFQSRCAHCHDDPENNRALPLPDLARLNPAHVFFALSNGPMKAQADGLEIDQMIELTGFISGNRKPWSPSAAHFCADQSIDSRGRFSRWAVDARSTSALPDGSSFINSGNVATLELAWAFGLPDVANARSQPVITEDTLFVAATSGHLFALDRQSGCIRWHRTLQAPPRTALTLGQVADQPALFFGDMEAHVNALDVRSGKMLWRSDATVSEHSMLTGAQVQHEDVLIVPVSLYEVGLAGDPEYECCISHGGVVALDSTTGKQLWTTHMTEPASTRGLTDAGVQSWGPSGVPVWSTPTIDSVRRLIYIGTGQNASLPATEYSDSVLALAIDNGEIVWHFQAIAGDAYNMACDQNPPGPNCPKWRGPDHDIGAAVVIAHDASGRELLIVGQKSGDVYALDPDHRGALIWQQRVGAGSALGGVHWGLAVADGVIYAPVADPPYPMPRYRPAPGLYALAVDDGKLLWENRVERGCETNLFEYFGRTELYPECTFFYGLSAPPLAANDLVFAAALDGKVRAFDKTTGNVLWEAETSRSFDTVNEVPAHGGAIDVAGVQLVDDMLYVQSGYGQFGQLPGNALLGYRLSGRLTDPAPASEQTNGVN